MGRISRGWALTKQSWAFVREEIDGDYPLIFPGQHSAVVPAACATASFDGRGRGRPRAAGI
jgi:hypothetical protein